MLYRNFLVFFGEKHSFSFSPSEYDWDPHIGFRDQDKLYVLSNAVAAPTLYSETQELDVAVTIAVT